jgi:hypothetical protein
LITIISLFVVLAVVAFIQFRAGRGSTRFPGPVPGTPLPTVSTT